MKNIFILNTCPGFKPQMRGINCSGALTAFCAVLLLFTHCKSSITVKDLQPEGSISQRLPHLIPILDVYPVAGNPVMVNLFQQADSAVRQPIILPPVLDSSESRTIRKSYFQNANADELQVFFARDVERNISRSEGPARGYISCQVTALEANPRRGYGWAYFHTLSMGATVVTGLPFFSAASSIEIEVVIKDQHQHPLKRYWGMADVKKYSGLYYGYRVSDIQRACHLEAFKMALANVKKQIEMDYDKLDQLLR